MFATHLEPDSERSPSTSSARRATLESNLTQPPLRYLLKFLVMGVGGLTVAFIALIALVAFYEKITKQDRKSFISKHGLSDCSYSSHLIGINDRAGFIAFGGDHEYQPTIAARDVDRLELRYNGKIVSYFDIAESDQIIETGRFAIEGNRLVAAGVDTQSDGDKVTDISLVIFSKCHPMALSQPFWSTSDQETMPEWLQFQSSHSREWFNNVYELCVRFPRENGPNANVREAA